MNWDDIRIFLAVARAESISGAGRGLGLDAGTVGRRIARLEAALGEALFRKSQQGYSLTAYGIDMQAQAETAERALKAMSEASSPGEGLSGQVRIGAPDGVANFLLPQVCARMAERHPNLEIQVVALPRVFNLSKREADMAIAVSAPAAGRLTVQKITDYALHLAACETYLTACGGITRPEELIHHPVVGYIADMIFDAELDYLGSLGLRSTKLASNSVSVQLNMLRASAGIGVVHDFALPFAPELRRILPQNTRLQRAFYLIRHADDRRNDRLTQFAYELSQGVRQEVTRLEAAT